MSPATRETARSRPAPGRTRRATAPARRPRPPRAPSRGPGPGGRPGGPTRPRAAAPRRGDSRPGAAARALLWHLAAPQVLSTALVRARSGRRVAGVLALYLLLSAAMAWRLVSVQVLSAQEYRELASQQTQREIELPARRGKIVDREGQPLAMSLTAASIYVTPRALAAGEVDRDALAVQLTELLANPEVPVDPERVRAALTSTEAFVYVARQVPREVGERVSAAKLPGIGVQEEPRRTYPAAPLAGPIIGRAGTDHVGLSGLELAYDDTLTGTPGTLQIERAENGVEIAAAPRQAAPPVPGTDVVLTLDREIQAEAESLLTDVVARSKANGASAVVLDADTGEVLALATAAGEEDPDTRPRAITDVYEPGSVNKVITLSAALEEGLITPSTSFAIPPSLQVGGKAFGEDHPPEDGRATVADIMARSSNLGSIQIAQLLGPERLSAYLGDFGYGRTTGLGFPNESGGIVLPVERWSSTSLPTIAIGHGVSATLLQVAGVFATVANDGEWIEPSLVRGTAGDDGALVPAEAPERRRVLSEGTADAVAEMLAGVVESEHGTGGAAAVPGYRVGGKTGTAKKPLNGGYEDGAYFASFAGFAPVEDPRYVVAVMVDEPHEGSYYGGTVAAPVFSDLMGFVLGHERIPPSSDAEPPTPQAVPSPAPQATATAAATAT